MPASSRDRKRSLARQRARILGRATGKTSGNKRKGKRRWLRRACILLPLAFFVFTALWVTLLKWGPVHYTPIMAVRSYEYRHHKDFRTQKRWVPLEKISSHVINAVIASEDNLFTQHHGFDTKAIRQAIRENKQGRKLRGASTISQQTAKNVFLFPNRTWVRKGLEVYFTFLIEGIWGKYRIMEVYLNVVELGKGVYGVGAGAQKYFSVPPSALTEKQAALFAAVLPDPLHRSPNPPGPYVAARSMDILSLMHKLANPAARLTK